jgi:hypothetical protein
VHRSDSERIIGTPPFEDAGRATIAVGPFEIFLRRRAAQTQFPHQTTPSEPRDFAIAIATRSDRDNLVVL